MPRPKSIRRDRACLVCGGTTRVAHMGMDVCRACTVFYRRSKGKSYICRSNTGKCPIEEECRKCRYDRLDRMVKKDGSRIDESDDSSDEYRPNNAPEAEEQASSSISSGDNYTSMPEKLRGTPLIHKLNPPHPLKVNDRDYPLYPATYDSVNRAHRIFLTTLLQFGAATFPEFINFKEKDRWTIVTNFFTRFRTFEAAYRADKMFPEEMEKGFQGYTLFYSEDVVDHYFDDCPNIGDNEEAKKVMRGRFKTNLGYHRESIRRISHRHEEFLASLAIMFWSTEGLDVSVEVTQASELYREIILRELHTYYREELRMQDYATRLGEVLMFLQTYEQRAGDMDKHLELLRLLNVFTEDTVVYRVTNV